MPRIRRVSLAAVVIAALTVVGGCASTADTDTASGSATVTVDSAYGEVAVPADPQQVAAVSYDTPWQLLSLGVTPIATIDYSQWIDSFTAEQQAGIADAATIGTYGEINYEALAAADPDLIVGVVDEVDEAAYERLSEIAPTVIVGGDARGDWMQITEELAAATGRTQTWEESKTAYETLRDQTTADYADVIAANTWINFSFGNDAGQFSVQLPTGSTGNLVVNELGLTYGPGAQIDDTDGGGYVSLPLEQLPTVFDGVTYALTFAAVDGTPYDAIEEIESSEIFQTLDVAQTGNIYAMRTSVTDYESAQDWINELVTNVLEPLSQ